MQEQQSQPQQVQKIMRTKDNARELRHGHANHNGKIGVQVTHRKDPGRAQPKAKLAGKNSNAALNVRKENTALSSSPT